MKKQSNLSRLLQIAGNHKYLTRASWVLSAVSALIALVPYYYIWLVMKEVLETAPAFSRARNLPHNGWMAVLFAVIAVLVYIAGLMCSHLGAFRIATNLRIQAMEHIVKLPLGLAERIGSGKLRKIVNESSAATETYLAHQLPDRAAQNAPQAPHRAGDAARRCGRAGRDAAPRRRGVQQPEHQPGPRVRHDVGRHAPRRVAQQAGGHCLQPIF